MSLGYYRDVELSFEESEARIRSSLADQGFGVLTEIDVSATLKEKLDADMAPYKILGACHPPTAYQALTANPEIGLLLPCNVTLALNDDGTVRVSAIRATTMMKVVDNEDVEALAAEIDTKLQAAVDGLAGRE